MKRLNITIPFLLIVTISILAGCGGDDNGTPNPEITGIQPDNGPPGTAVTISGSDFSPTASNNAVSFNGVAATVTSATESEIQTEVPEGAESGVVIVTVNGETATGPSFTVEAEAPGISSIEPDSGTVGTEVVIQGMNFSSAASENTITFNGTEAPVRGAAEDQLITEVPNGATDGPIEVTVEDKTATGPDFNVITEGAIEVNITTSGPDQDADGYNLIIDGTDEFSTDANDTVYVNGLSEDTHDLELSDVADNCSVESDNPQMADVIAGDTTSVSFEAACQTVLNNRIVFVSDRGPGGQFDLYTMDPDGSNIDQVTNNSDVERFPDISPDGTKIAFSKGSGGEGGNIWVVNADGTNPTQLTTSGQDNLPVWSPDGSQILFTSDRDGATDIFVMNADGSAKNNITDNGDVDFAASWSPDGTQIVFASDRDGDPEIFVSNADGTTPQQLTDNTDFDTFPVWSPDGFLHGSEWR
jgi:dipeptidyl aminopeptidase/acylaminoacyl peptidase